MKSCLIVGAGLAGLTAARVLRAHGCEVKLLDKGRGVGGRMATRRIGAGRFDHGAQFFTVRDARFQKAVDEWVEKGWARAWFSEGGHVRYCGVEGMNGIAKELAKGFDVRLETTVKRVERIGSGWRVGTQSGEEFLADGLLVTAPVPQALTLLDGCLDELPGNAVAGLHGVEYDPCFALMVVLNGPSLIPAPGYVRPAVGPIAYVADNAQKGISSGGAALTMHAGGDFSRAHFEEDRDAVAGMLLEAGRQWFGSEVVEWQIHRWKFSQPVQGFDGECLFVRTPAVLGVAGDGFGGARIEGAFLSGLKVGERMLEPGNKSPGND